MPGWHMNPFEMKSTTREAHAFMCEHPEPVNMVDYVFVIDTTRTMECVITESKQTMMELIEYAHMKLGIPEPPEKEEGEEEKEEQINTLKEDEIPNDYDSIIKFGVVAYRDHPGLDYDRISSKDKPGTYLIKELPGFEPSAFQYVTMIQNLSSKKEVLGFIETLNANGGTDLPEALMDGLYDAVYNITWRENSERIVVLVSDAPPHGREFINYASLARRNEDVYEDFFPDGCPCGKTVDPIL